MYDGPIRDGSRGGRDQFSWESVKGDKDREFYLGHSVKALVGHWQKNRDPYWYSKGKSKHDSKLEEEIKAVKEREEELMLEALGMKKPTKKQTTDFGKRLQKFEVDELLRRREREEGEQQEVDELGPRALGFRRTAAPPLATATHEVLEGVGLSSPPPSKAHLSSKPDQKKRNKEEKSVERKRRREEKEEESVERRRRREEKERHRMKKKERRHRSRGDDEDSLKRVEKRRR